MRVPSIFPGGFGLGAVPDGAGCILSNDGCASENACWKTGCRAQKGRSHELVRLIQFIQAKHDTLILTNKSTSTRVKEVWDLGSTLLPSFLK